jgi:hypothetical protein
MGRDTGLPSHLRGEDRDVSAREVDARAGVGGGEFRVGTVHSMGVRSPVSEAGPAGAREAVVYVHGNPGSRRDFGMLLRRTGAFARSVAFDMPGFGEADKPREFDYSVPGFARRLPDEFVRAIREAVCRDFLFGVRLSASDHNSLPVNVRWPPVRPLRHYWFGNGLHETLQYGRWLRDLGVDFLHITNGFGFINPKENPGAFPARELRLFYNSVRHLSRKAAVRATLMNSVPFPLLDRSSSTGWKFRRGANLEDARRFRETVGLPVIANGGFQQRTFIEWALVSGGCDMVSMARPLLANPDLPEQFRAGVDVPSRPCTFCNRCTIRTTIGPLGCYEPRRFGSREEMEAQILAWASPS